DRKIADPVERISLGVDKGTRHRCNGTPAFRIPCSQMPCTAAAHGVAGKERAVAIRAIGLGDDLEHRDDVELAQSELALTFRRDGGALLCCRIGLAEYRGQAQRI